MSKYSNFSGDAFGSCEQDSLEPPRERRHGNPDYEEGAHLIRANRIDTTPEGAGWAFDAWPGLVNRIDKERQP